ncbi:MAG: PD-(D/E)XK nuclease family protein, partial [Candidatus Omnitrophica bacterium]|nr:PD-(D/E)XK nuclease family protein [Candidatus Omnitrophota bacterium]
RLFYVGMTRAKKRLWLTASSSYTPAKIWRTSRFVKETLGEITGETQAKLPIVAPLFLPREEEKYFFDLPLITIKQFSYTQLKSYEHCPFFYKLKYIICVPELPKAPYSFGQTIHLTLEDFYSLIKNKKKVSKEKLLTLYKRNWVREGYITKEQEKERKIKGRRALEDFYRLNSSDFGEPVYLEQFFKVKIGDVFLRGRIDRIDRLPDGEYEVIDYKSGNPPARKNIASEEQLTIYALACKEVLKFFPKVLSFYYLGTNEKLSTARKPSDLELIKEKILSTISKIKKREFPPLGDKRKCKMCSYRLICPQRMA